MDLNEAKKIVKEQARKYFPEFNRKPWYLQTIEWDDNSFKVEYMHGEDVDKKVIQYKVALKYGDEKYLKVSIGIVKSVEHYIYLKVLLNKKIR